jgi:glycine cleavage system aminomethyltransferase T
VKKTPFHDAGLALGAKMVELFGYYLPWEYSAGHEKEHLGTRNAASLCDLDYMGEFIIEGADALAFVQKLATNDYSKKTAGSVQYTAMCDAQGNMIDDGTIWSLGEHKFMVVSGAESDFDWIKSNAGGFNITLKNITSEHTTLALQGPKSAHVIDTEPYQQPECVLSRTRDLKPEGAGPTKTRAGDWKWKDMPGRSQQNASAIPRLRKGWTRPAECSAARVRKPPE